MIGTVKVIRIRFLEDEVYDGSIPQKCYDDARTEEFECDDVEEAARVLQREGLTFAATNNEWAASPDGSRIIDYGIGQREETTAHLDSFSDADFAQIVAAVG